MDHHGHHQEREPERDVAAATETQAHVAGDRAANHEPEHDGHHGTGSGHPAAAHSAEHAGHGDKHAGHSPEMFARLFWIALVLTIPVVVYAELFQDLLGYTTPDFPGSRFIGMVLGSVIYWYTGWVFLAGAYHELRSRQPGMMTLVALAISSAYAYSLAITFGIFSGTPFYWELATLVTIMLLGHWMELRAIGSAQSALSELARLLPDTAERVVDGGIEEIAVSDLREGDVVLVRPGARIPSDGVVIDGRSQVNESMITGESRPIDKDVGLEVIGGSINGSGSLRVRVSRIGESTMLAGIMRLVQEAQSSRTRAQALADRAAFWLTLVAIAVSVVTFVAWTLARGLDDYTVERTVTTLVVACPHALGLAIPLVIAISTAISASSGILVRDRMALERSRNLDMVVFDKTGTLTKGEQGIVDVVVEEGTSKAAALALAAAVEGDSEHPIARAFRASAAEVGSKIPEVGQFEALPGRGVQAVVEGRRLRLGGPQLLAEYGVDLSDSFRVTAEQWGEHGQSVVYLIDDRHVLAAFAVADVIRPESRSAVARLKALGLRVAMLTGDSDAVARWVASELGIDEYFAEVLPGDKHEKIQEIQRRGLAVAMVGDGVNDAPALAQADVGIAIGAGTDVAVASAGIVLVRSDPRDVSRIVKLGQESYKKMIQNLSWAVGYNAIALPLAAGVLAGVGIVMPVWVGAMLMSLSTIIVAVNAQLLRRVDLQWERSGDQEPEYFPA